ncbi:methyltransferase-like protein 27 [Polypterus senegalus]|nr:methyltransferase-like protein 27 [Polypterus senegalus]
MANRRSFSEVKESVLAAHKDVDPEGKVKFYDSWADNYEQDVETLEYRAPYLAAETLSSAFQGNRDLAVVLDVACGTGLVVSWLNKMGFRNFHGIDGSEGMLEMAKTKGLYQNLKYCMLGTETLSSPISFYDAVLIVGALSVGQVPVKVIWELWQVTKPGGYICMTTRANNSNIQYKDQLESLQRSMEEKGMWEKIAVREVEKWERAVSENDCVYISGVVYLYRKTCVES